MGSPFLTRAAETEVRATPTFSQVRQKALDFAFTQIKRASKVAPNDYSSANLLFLLTSEIAKRLRVRSNLPDPVEQLDMALDDVEGNIKKLLSRSSWFKPTKDRKKIQAVIAIRKLLFPAGNSTYESLQKIFDQASRVEDLNRLLASPYGNVFQPYERSLELSIELAMANASKPHLLNVGSIAVDALRGYKGGNKNLFKGCLLLYLHFVKSLPEE